MRRYMHRALDVGAPAIMPLLGPGVRSVAEVGALLDASAALQAELIALAADEGSLRAGVQFSDVGLALARFSRPIGHDFEREFESGIAHRHLDVFIDGLRHRSGPALTGPELTLGRLRSMGRRPTRSESDSDRSSHRTLRARLPEALNEGSSSVYRVALRGIDTLNVDDCRSRGGSQWNTL